MYKIYKPHLDQLCHPFPIYFPSTAIVCHPLIHRVYNHLYRGNESVELIMNAARLIYDKVVVSSLSSMDYFFNDWYAIIAALFMNIVSPPFIYISAVGCT